MTTDTTTREAHTNTKFAAREELMFGMQIAISRIADEIVKNRAIDEFRRVEKLFGFEPGSWSPYT